MNFIDEFDTQGKTKTGGVTGSARVKHKAQGKNYQLKPSILDNPSKLRRMKADHTDRENFGEVIASCIGRKLLKPGQVPGVSLVYDRVNKRVSIASKYLEGESVRTLDEYAQQKGLIIKKHVRLVAGTISNKKNGEMGLDSLEMADLKQSLAEAVAVSAVVGDHDVNPGNMLVLSKNKQDSIARIDFGHALNDLLNASKTHGGQLRDADNPILDFFNRQKIAGVGGDSSKLWRDYPGLIPSQEMVDALNKIAKDFDSRVSSGVAEAKKEFEDLILQMNKVRDVQGVTHVRNSLAAIYTNISGKKLDANLSMDEALSLIFAGIEKFMQRQGKNMQKVANIMQLQLDIDAALQSGQALPLRALELLNSPMSYYSGHSNFPLQNGKIQWLKVGAEPAFSGSIEEYVLYKVNQLTKESPDDKSVIARNYRAFRDQWAEHPQVATSDQQKTPNVTTVYKQALRQTSILDVGRLISIINNYIDELVIQKRGSVMGYYSQSEKMKAALDLIQVLNGNKKSVSAANREILTYKNGTLNRIINNFLDDCVAAGTLQVSSEKEGLDCLLSAIKSKSIGSNYASYEAFRPGH